MGRHIEPGERRAFEDWYRRSGLYRPYQVPHKIEWDDLVFSLFRHRRFANGTLLDVGSRTARYREVFEGQVSRFLTLDLPHPPDAATPPNVYADAVALPFQSGSIGTVLMTQMLGMVFDFRQAVGEAHRVLAPGGCLIVTHNQKAGLFDATSDYMRFTRPFYERAFLESGFTLEVLEPRGGTMALIGETLSSFVYYRWQRLGVPYALRFAVSYPVEIVFALLDRLWYEDLDPLGHIAIGRKSG